MDQTRIPASLFGAGNKNREQTAPSKGAILDDAHVGDIHGAFGTIRCDDIDVHRPWRRLKTLLAIVGPGLIVMVGDNDAGAFGTYTQVGQNYGTSLLWTLLLLVPVLYVNQEMVLRLGAVSDVGHAHLIFERFGKVWGAFSVIDLFILNALTLVTEFIGLSLGLDYLGVSKVWVVPLWPPGSSFFGRATWWTSTLLRHLSGTKELISGSASRS
jgi:hypothetical protein